MALDLQRIPGYCALCRSRCGAVAVVENGRLVAVEPDPTHPTGQGLCAKGRAAPELVADPARLLYPMVRTRPKGDPDPGWKRVSWDEALELTASRLRDYAGRYGPETVAFAVTSPSATGISDHILWIDRFIRLYGSPNNCYATEICNWHKDHAPEYVFGVGLPGPDFDHTGCIVLWGHNPSTAWLAHAHRAAQARRRGARLLVVDPRRAGLAAKADLWLRVRPGTDGALALGIAGVMIDEGWFDRNFAVQWTNGPLLVRSDTGRFLRGEDLGIAAAGEDGRPRYVVWDASTGGPALYDPATRRWERDDVSPALMGRFTLDTPRGPVRCRTAFDLYAGLCRRYPPERVEEITGVPAGQVREAARLLWTARPVCYYAWTGVGQSTNATQTNRAIAALYGLTGCFDAPGGNVIFPKIPVNDVAGLHLLPPEQRAKALGLKERPLGPSRWGWVTAADLYRAILEGEPYPVRALVGFGANLLLSRGDVRRARQALERLEFTVYADMFMTPTAELADVVLPVTSPWETEAFRVGFEVSPRAQSVIQLRRRAAAPRGEARSDTEIVFALAQRVGLGEEFWHGSLEDAYRHLLEPSGVRLEDLYSAPGGRVVVPLELRYRKYAERRDDGSPAGFATPTGKVEIYSEVFLDHGYDPLPVFVEPWASPRTRPDLAERYPLILTSAKLPQYSQSQQRSLPSLRRRVRDPLLEIHPETAAARGIADGDWVKVETPDGCARARAALNPHLDPQVVVGQHGWWQASPGAGAPGYDPLSPEGANFNLLISSRESDPVSGSVPHRAYVCQVSRVEG